MKFLIFTAVLGVKYLLSALGYLLLIFMQNRFWVATVILVFSYTLRAQSSQQIDSLVSILNTNSDPRIQVQAQGILSWEYHLKDSTKSLMYARAALEGAQVLGDEAEVVQAQLYLGYAWFGAWDFERAKTCFLDGLRQAEAINNPMLQAHAHFGMGEMLIQKGELNASIGPLENALALAHDIGDTGFEGQCLTKIGEVYRYLGNYSEAIPYLLEGLSISDSLGNDYQVTESLYLLTVCRVHLGEYSKALTNGMLCVKLATELQDSYLLAQSYRALGHVYDLSGDYVKALDAYENSLEAAEASDISDLICASLSNVGHLYRLINKNGQAISYLSRSLAIAENLIYPRILVFNHYEIGAAYVQMQDYVQADAHLVLAENKSREMGLNRLTSAILIEKGRVAVAERNYAAGQKVLQEALALAREIDKPDYIRDASLVLAKAHEGVGDFKSANDMVWLYHTMSDSLRSHEVTRTLTMQDAAYAFQRERDSIQFQQEADTIRFESSIERRNWANGITAVGMVFAFILVLVIARSYKNKQKANQELADLNEEISEQNSAIQKQNAEIKSQRDFLEDLVQAKDRFFSIISHDLRGPVHSFTSLSYLINKYLEQEDYVELKKLVEALDSNAKQVSQLLDNLLTWAMQQRGVLTIKRENLNVTECLEEAISLFALQAESKGVRIVLEGAVDLQAYADRNSFMTIFRNLISNAVKFTPKQGLVRITVMDKEGVAQVQVEDTGVGMHRKQLEKLFQVADKEVTRGTQGERGTGLGMPLVHDFVRLNEGEIEVSSEVGGGTVFTVLLPIPQRNPAVVS